MFRAASDPAIADEVDFLKPLQGWVDGSPSIDGFWHSPFYPWLLSLFGKIAGWNPFTARLIGLVSWLGAAIFVVKAAGLLGVKTRRDQNLILTFSLILPPCLGSSLIVDYDTSLLVLATSAYIYSLVYYAQAPILKAALIWGAWISVCLMAKETTPLIYPIGVWATLLHKNGFWKAFSWSVFSLLIGVSLFLFVTLSWCAMYGLPISSTFDMAILGLQTHGKTSLLSSRGIGAFLYVKIFPVFWVGVPLLLLFTNELKSVLRPSSKYFGVAVTVVFVLFAYTFALNQMTYHFPKYMAPVLPWFVLIAMKGGFNRFMVSKNFTFLLTLLLVWAFVAPNPMKVLYLRNATGLLVFLGYFVGAFLIVLAFRFRMTIRLKETLVLLTLAFSLSNLFQAILGSRSITYWPGEKSFSETAEAISYIREKRPEAQILIPIKDLAYANPNDTWFLPPAALANKAKELCEKRSPFAVISRIREESSVTRSSDLQFLSTCLGSRELREDIVLMY